MRLSPDGYYYRFDPHGPAGERLVRKRHMEQQWEAGKPEFTIQTMSPEELRFVADLIDEVRANG
jgi:hypothetical protein